MFPADTDRTHIRLPYRQSWYGSGRQPHDTAQGEYDYNPFAYDVGNLGKVLCTEYQVNLIGSTALLCLNGLSAFDTTNTHARAVPRSDDYSKHSSTLQC
jgi:hypothetical protein